MITNDKQYKIAKSQVELFRQSFDNLASNSDDLSNIHPKLLEANRSAIESKLNELINDVLEYEELKAGRILTTEIKSLEDLPTALIKARIANGLTQSELASKLEMKMQQIQRYEAERYGSASLKTLLRISTQLGVSITADVQLKAMDTPDLLDIKNYPFKQMYQRNWFGNFIGNFNEAVKDSTNLIANFFENAKIDDFKYSLNKRSFRSKGTINEFALNAWYARVIYKAREQKVQTPFDKSSLDSEWLNNLAKLSKSEEDLKMIPDYLRNSGIRFVIEPQLDGTYLDGAALLLDEFSPVIALTLRYDRLDNFWFVLFHEIAHIILHLSQDIDAIFDDLDVKLDGIEAEADALALDALIPNEVWRKSMVRFRPSEKTILNQAEVLHIHPALVAGRIRRESGQYHQFVDLIGQNKVRKQFNYEMYN